VSNPKTLEIGRRADNGTQYTAAKLDSIRLYSRALSAPEVAALYAENRAGNPNVWRWAGRRVYSIPATGGLLLKRRRMAAGAA
jgi:hypothetical protein